MKRLKVRIEQVFLAEQQAIGRGRKPWWGDGELTDTRVLFRAQPEELRQWALEIVREKKVNVELSPEQVLEVWTGDRPISDPRYRVQIHIEPTGLEKNK